MILKVISVQLHCFISSSLSLSTERLTTCTESYLCIHTHLYTLIKSRTLLVISCFRSQRRVSLAKKFFFSDRAQTFFGHVSSNFPTFFFFARGLSPPKPYAMQKNKQYLLKHAQKKFERDRRKIFFLRAKPYAVSESKKSRTKFVI